MIDFTDADLRRFSPRMAAFYKDVLLSESGRAVLKSAGILDNGSRWCHFLGQVGAETAGGTILRESLNYSSAKRISEVWPARAKKSSPEELKSLVRNPVGLGDWAYGGRMGNRKGKIGKPHSDGYDYRGGGALQVTGRSNVQKLCDLAGIEIRPDILDDPVATLQLACAEWKDAGCNALADANDILGISKAINTGSATSGIVPNGMEHRTAWFNKAKAIWWDAEMKATDTVPPPTVAQNVQTTMQKSWTVFGGLSALGSFLGYVFNEALSVVLDAATQVDVLAPAGKVLSGFGLSVANVTLTLTAAAILFVIFRRGQNAANGSHVK